MKRPNRHWCFMPGFKRGPGAGVIITGEAAAVGAPAVPFRREPYLTVPLSGLPTLRGGRYDEGEKDNQW